jgi:hypothetical protein
MVLHKQHTCTRHSQRVNTGQCREVEQVERKVTWKLYVPDDGRYRLKYAVRADTWSVYTRIVSTGE